MKANQFPSLRGAGTVFRFTMQQHYKALSVKILLLCLVVLGAASVPLMRLGFATEEPDSTAITKLYLRNDTDFPFDGSFLTADERYANIELLETETSDETFGELLATQNDAAALTLSFDANAGGVCISVLYAEDSGLNTDDLSAIGNAAVNAFHETRLASLSISQAQLEILEASTYAQVQKLSQYQNNDTEADVDTHAFVNLGYSYFVLILATLAMSYIFALCMEEKTTRLVESLLVSIRPTALLIGKITAVTVFLLIGLGLLFGSFGISLLFAKTQGSIAFLTEALDAIGLLSVIQNLHVGDLLLGLVALILAYAMMAFLSGILGSCCSKNEDVQQASLGVVMVILVGYLSAAILPAIESDAVNIVASIFPLTAMFVAPANYVCGKISLAVLLMSFALQLVTVIWLARTAGAVYEMMLLYRGGFPKPKQLIAMLRENRAAHKGGNVK